MSFWPIEEDSWRNQEKEKRGPKLASSVVPHAVASHGVLDPEGEAVLKCGDYLHIEKVSHPRLWETAGTCHD